MVLRKRGSRKCLARSRNLRSVCDRSRSPVFSWFYFSELSLEFFYVCVSIFSQSLEFTPHIFCWYFLFSFPFLYRPQSRSSPYSVRTGRVEDQRLPSSACFYVVMSSHTEFCKADRTTSTRHRKNQKQSSVFGSFGVVQWVSCRVDVLQS